MMSMSKRWRVILGVAIGGLVGCQDSSSDTSTPSKPIEAPIEDTNTDWRVESEADVADIDFNDFIEIAVDEALGISAYPTDVDSEAQKDHDHGEAKPNPEEDSDSGAANALAVVPSLTLSTNKQQVFPFSTAELTVERLTSLGVVELLETGDYFLKMVPADHLRYESGQVIGLKAGIVTLSVESGGITSTELTIEVLPPLKMCGALNDTEQNSTKGDCLKVIEGLTGDANGKYFSSSPSVEFLKSLSYVVDNSGDNVGRTYAGQIQGLGYHAPMRGLFARFRQDGAAENEGQGGQYDRYCQDLAESAFAGRLNWRRVKATEISALVSDYGELFGAFGFPSMLVYWTSSKEALTITQQTAGAREFLYASGFNWDYSRVSNARKSRSFFAVCVSEINDAIQSG